MHLPARACIVAAVPAILSLACTGCRDDQPDDSMKFFKSKSKPAAEATFKEKTEKFWTWWAAESDRILESVDITAWSPSMAEIGEQHSQTILFLLLDEALGENGVEAWLGTIDLGDGKLEHSFPLTELPEFVESTAAAQGWNKPPLEDCYSAYHLPEPIGDFPRGDTIAGTTRAMNLVGAYLDAHGKIDDPIAGSGAAFLFLQLPRGIFPEGGELDRRGELEDALERTLAEHHSGIFLGGATGHDAVYIELLIFDGDRSRDLIRSTLDAHGLRGQYQFESFTK